MGRVDKIKNYRSVKEMGRVDKGAEEKGIEELMGDYNVFIVTDILSRETTEMLKQHSTTFGPDDDKTYGPCLIARNVPFRCLNRGLCYDWRIQFINPTVPHMLSHGAYSIFESETPKAVVESIGITRPDFVRTLKNNIGYGQICVSPCIQKEEQDKQWHH